MPPADAARRRTAAGVRATGVSPVAGSVGHPVPGGTGDAKRSPVTGCGWRWSMSPTLGEGLREDGPEVDLLRELTHVLRPHARAQAPGGGGMPRTKNPLSQSTTTPVVAAAFVRDASCT